MGGLFGGSKPEPIEPKRMPDPESKESEDAARRQMLQYRARSGRQSTVLSGGGDYQRNKLGAG